MNTLLKNKSTLVIGASSNPQRYSNIAIHMLREYDYATLALGLREGEVEGISIVKNKELLESEDIDTITLYLNPSRQREYYQWIVNRKPRRVIFNPGTENPEFMQMLRENGIEVVLACTLVMLRTGQY